MKGRPVGSPRRVAALFLALVLAPSALLVGLGWQLFQQDRATAQRHVQDRLQQTTDLAVAAIDAAMVATEQALGNPAVLARSIQSDATVIAVDRGGVATTAGLRLPFVPVPNPGPEVPAGAFAEADRLRQRGDLDLARRDYADLTHSPHPAVRAGALLRLSSNAAPPEKLRLLTQLAGTDDSSIDGVPLSLLAQWAICVELEKQKDLADLRREAAALARDLEKGRWSINRGVYEPNRDDARRWVGDTSQARTPAERLAAAVEYWWQTVGDGERSGRLFLPQFDDVTVIWITDGDRRVAMAALPSFAEREWVAAGAAIAAKSNVRVATRDPAVRTARAGEEVRLEGATNLPWTIVAIDGDRTAELARLEGRRSLWLAGLAALVILIGAGAYLVTRVINRELAVARLQSDFVAAVSHEFRTPLTSLTQLSEILVDQRIVDDDRRLAYYRALARQTTRLSRLVESLLDLGRLEAGTTPYRLEPLDACALVRAIVDEFDHELAGKGVRIELDIDGDALEIRGDRQALTNALWNLLDNAVKYSPDSRTVGVTVTRDTRRVLIRVRDRGIGIPAEEQRAIFEKFVRGAQAKAEGFKGTGIGLSMVHHIVLAHGGEVGVESAPGTGSTFTMAFPLV